MSENKRKAIAFDATEIQNKSGDSIIVRSPLLGSAGFDNSDPNAFVQQKDIEGFGNDKVLLTYDETDIRADGNVVIRSDDLDAINGLGVIYVYVNDQYASGAYLERSDNSVPGFGGYIGASGLTIELTFI